VVAYDDTRGISIILIECQSPRKRRSGLEKIEREKFGRKLTAEHVNSFRVGGQDVMLFIIEISV
jgi:hypothetical protein